MLWPLLASLKRCESFVEDGKRKGLLDGAHDIGQNLPRHNGEDNESSLCDPNETDCDELSSQDDELSSQDGLLPQAESVMASGYIVQKRSGPVYPWFIGIIIGLAVGVGAFLLVQLIWMDDVSTKVENAPGDEEATVDEDMPRIGDLLGGEVAPVNDIENPEPALRMTRDAIQEEDMPPFVHAAPLRAQKVQAESRAAPAKGVKSAKIPMTFDQPTAPVTGAGVGVKKTVKHPAPRAIMSPAAPATPQAVVAAPAPRPMIAAPPAAAPRPVIAAPPAPRALVTPPPASASRASIAPPPPAPRAVVSPPQPASRTVGSPAHPPQPVSRGQRGRPGQVSRF